MQRVFFKQSVSKDKPGYASSLWRLDGVHLSSFHLHTCSMLASAFSFYHVLDGGSCGCPLLQAVSRIRKLFVCLYFSKRRSRQVATLGLRLAGGVSRLTSVLLNLCTTHTCCQLCTRLEWHSISCTKHDLLFFFFPSSVFGEIWAGVSESSRLISPCGTPHCLSSRAGILSKSNLWWQEPWAGLDWRQRALACALIAWKPWRHCACVITLTRVTWDLNCFSSLLAGESLLFCQKR